MSHKVGHKNVPNHVQPKRGESGNITDYDKRNFRKNEQCMMNIANMESER